MFPDDFKFANITPAFTANDPLDKNNYRSISILSVLSKVLEGIMNDQLSDYFNHILSTLISAFRNNYSCQSILLKMIEDWKSALDKQNIIGAVTIDLSKTFYTILHSLLVEMSNSAILMLKSYLKERYQRVMIGNNMSEWIEMKCGVAQVVCIRPIVV